MVRSHVACGCRGLKLLRDSQDHLISLSSCIRDLPGRSFFPPRCFSRPFGSQAHRAAGPEPGPGPASGLALLADSAVLAAGIQRVHTIAETAYDIKSLTDCYLMRRVPCLPVPHAAARETDGHADSVLVQALALLAESVALAAGIYCASMTSRQMK